MLIELASPNDDLRRLLERGYALAVDGGYLITRDIPYLDDKRSLQWGAIVTKLVFIDKLRVTQDDHQIFFAGSVPYGLDGQPIPNLGGGPTALPLARTDIVVQRSFSNKPPSGAFADFFEKIDHYTRVIGGPAMHLFNANPFTFRIDVEDAAVSVFKFRDTLSSRAEIGDLATIFKDEVAAVIGLGGTGAYTFDLLCKTPFKEVRAFDGDVFHVHNSFRSPGRLQQDELGKGKADVYRARYDNFREGLTVHGKYIDSTSAADFEGVTFAFVCVDKGSARSEIFDLLISLKIPFIDVGMGLNRKQGALAGTIRATYYSAAAAQQIRDKQLAEMVDDPDDIYRKNVQIGELNALNACLAVILYKQSKGFYVDGHSPYHLLMDIAEMKIFSESGE